MINCKKTKKMKKIKMYKYYVGFIENKLLWHFKIYKTKFLLLNYLQSSVINC